MRPIIGSLLLSLNLVAQAPNSTPSPNPTPSPAPQSSPLPGSQPSKKFPSPFAHPNPAGGMEILSDTMGVDFRPYMIVMKEQINKRWLQLMPKSALPPELKSGEVVLRFSILHNGKVKGLIVEESSGDKSLDQAAFGALAESSPLPALPESFIGDYLSIRANFSYNPAKQKQPQEKPPAPSPTPQDSPSK